MTKRDRERAAWYAVRSATRQEKRAIAGLTEAGITVYAPHETRWSRVGREREAKSAPLFAGYLFALLTPEDFHLVRGIDGVHNIVSNMGAPVRIDAAKLMWLAYLESQGEYDWTWSATPKVYAPKRGEQVCVVKGQYTGFLGTVMEIRGKNRALLMVQLFGRRQKIERPISELVAA